MNNLIKKILLKTIEVDMPIDSIVDTASLTDELNVSSLQFITFVVELEKAFSFSLHDDDTLLDDIDTIQGIADWFASRGIEIKPRVEAI